MPAPCGAGILAAVPPPNGGAAAKNPLPAATHPRPPRARDRRAMPRFAHIFEAAADTLSAYYQAVAEVNIDSLMGLWIDEEFVSCICADGAHLHGLDALRWGLPL